MDDSIKKLTYLTLLVAVVISMGFSLMGQQLWAGGFLFGVCWSLVNFLLTIQLLKVAILQYPKEKMRMLLLLKFPLLYLLVFLVLIYKVFPVSGVLIGLLPVLIMNGIYKLCQKPT